jgi:hypothetical protein
MLARQVANARGSAGSYRLSALSLALIKLSTSSLDYSSSSYLGSSSCLKRVLAIIFFFPKTCTILKS